MPGLLTTFVHLQEETLLRQEESRERHHAEELQILRDLPTSRENNNNNDNRTQETTTKTQATPRPPLLKVTANDSKFFTWRESWKDFEMLQQINKLPLESQHAYLRSS